MVRGERVIYIYRVRVSLRWQDQWGRGALGIGPFRVDVWVWRGRYKKCLSGSCQVIVCILFVPFLFQYMQKRLPGGAQNQAVFPVHIAVFPTNITQL
jgi:hypothetical protein